MMPDRVKLTIELEFESLRHDSLTRWVIRSLPWLQDNPESNRSHYWRDVMTEHLIRHGKVVAATVHEHIEVTEQPDRDNPLNNEGGVEWRRLKD